MKITQGTFYKAKYINGGETGDRCDTVEAMKEAIAKTNEHYKANGYQQSQFIIVSVQWGKVFDDNGVFLSETETVTRIEIYPETL